MRFKFQRTKIRPLDGYQSVIFPYALTRFENET